MATNCAPVRRMRAAIVSYSLLYIHYNKMTCFGVSAPGRNDEDELYETYITETNLVYRWVDNQLRLADEYSGSILKYAMLKSKEVT